MGRPMSEATRIAIGNSNRVIGRLRANQLFWSNVQRGDDAACWLWTGRIDPAGYGKFSSWRAHRLMYERHAGQIPDGLVVCHRCDNPSCVNPAHLFVGTQGDNMRDASAKGRLRTGASHPMRHPEVVRKVADAQRGVACPSRAKFGPKHSPESRLKMRLAKLGRPAVWAVNRKLASA